MTDIKTLEALIEKHLPGMSLTVNQPLIEALNLYIEEKVREAYKKGYAKGGVDEILRHEKTRADVIAELKEKQ